MQVDLRSDTVTRPTPAMRRAMADADVGDDVYGEDPTAQRLEEETAALLGKEAALFVPTGTMANQIALMLHCRPGDAVVVGAAAHCMAFESGAGAALAGVQFDVASERGLYDASELERALAKSGDLFPRTRLVALENTHNRDGGAVWPSAQAHEVAALAHARGLPVHLDGARIWNAAIATGETPAALASYADTVSVCFSKGLGAPVGSAFAGSHAHVREARRFRKMLGGGMRQVGVLCAAARHALAHHRSRLAEDHALAAQLARSLSRLPGLVVHSPETNIVLVDLRTHAAPELVSRLREAGVLLNAVSPTRLRAVTHRDLSTADIDAASGVMARVLS
ncbi:MAG: GntG family PLP-dependent aldolase [Polyangiales bacterium]